MIRQLGIGLLLLLLSPNAWPANKVIAEGIAASNSTIFISTPSALIGIGTTNPAYRLHLSSGIIFLDGNAALGEIINYNQEGLRFQPKTGSNAFLTFYTGATRLWSMGQDLAIDNAGFVIYDALANKSPFIIRETANQASNTLVISSGSVGIGTTNPGATLGTNGLNASTTAQIINGFASATADTLEIQGNGNQMLQINANSTSVGGTTPPAFILKPLVTGATAMIVNGAASATADTLEVQGNGNQVLQINANNTSVAGTVPPVMKLTALTASATTAILNAAASANADILDLQVNGTGKVSFLASGNVGIGTTNPGAALDINGGLQVGNAILSRSTFSAAGFFNPPIYTNTQIDTLSGVLGALIVCSNCAFPYDVCVGTGTAASQWMALSNSSQAGVTAGGKSGCGTGN